MTLNQAWEFVALFQHLTGRYPVLYQQIGLSRSSPDDKVMVMFRISQSQEGS